MKCYVCKREVAKPRKIVGKKSGKVENICPGCYKKHLRKAVAPMLNSVFT